MTTYIFSQILANSFLTNYVYFVDRKGNPEYEEGRHLSAGGFLHGLQHQELRRIPHHALTG